MNTNNNNDGDDDDDDKLYCYCQTIANGKMIRCKNKKCDFQFCLLYTSPSPRDS